MSQHALYQEPESEAVKWNVSNNVKFTPEFNFIFTI